jgi:hypothetical protein
MERGPRCGVGPRSRSPDSMARADWTYEVPAAGSSAVGLEDYAVESSAGEFIGKVLAVIQHKNDVFLAIERGLPPARRDRRAVSWSAVETIDHAGPVVRLRIPAAQLEDALELEPKKAVENGRGQAVRLSRLPARLAPSSSPASPGPVDRPTYTGALVLGLLGAFSALLVVTLLTVTQARWPLALVVLPVALFAGAGALAHRFFFGRQSERI